jgi:cation diffusion facilitator family transporter
LLDVGHAGARHQGRLAIAFAMVAAFFVVELVVGLATGSLALISDAGHMAADVVALGAALVATRVASTRGAGGRRTYGSYRAEVLASGLAVLLMLGVAVYVVLEAFARAGSDVEVAAGPMLVVGGLGLVVNVVSLVLLHAGSGEAMAVRAAYLEVMADAAGSVGVLVAGILVAVTGDSVWDTVVAVAIGGFVAVRAVPLGRQVLSVLGQHAPPGTGPRRRRHRSRGHRRCRGRARPPCLDADLGDARRHRAPRGGRRDTAAAGARRVAAGAARRARHRARDRAGRDPRVGRVPRGRLVRPQNGAGSTHTSLPDGSR